MHFAGRVLDGSTEAQHMLKYYLAKLKAKRKHNEKGGRAVRR